MMTLSFFKSIYCYIKVVRKPSREPNNNTTGEPGKVHGRDRVGIVGSPVGTEPAGSVFGENCLIEKPGVQDEGSRHAAKRCSDPPPGSLPRS